MVLENILVDMSQDDQHESELLRVLPRVLDTHIRRVGRRSIIQTVDERRIRQLQAQKKISREKKIRTGYYIIYCSQNSEGDLISRFRLHMFKFVSVTNTDLLNRQKQFEIFQFHTVRVIS